MRRHAWWIAGLVAVGLWAWQQAPRTPSPVPPGELGTTTTPSTPRPAPSSVGTTTDLPAWLPAEARDTLLAIERGPPYPYRQDGGVFENRERRLPQRPRGHYREFTVETPGSDDRGARRIIIGGDPPVEFFYTRDHYRSFRSFAPTGARDGRH